MSMHAAQLATQLADEAVTGIGAGTTLLRHEPLGVVSILTPWNFPHCLNVMKLNQRAGRGQHRRAQALAADPARRAWRWRASSTSTPTSRPVWSTSSRRRASRPPSCSPPIRAIDMISFTGSSVVGREVMSRRGRHHEADPAGVRRQVGQHRPRRHRGHRRDAAADAVRLLLAARRAGLHPAQPAAASRFAARRRRRPAGRAGPRGQGRRPHRSRRCRWAR